MGKFASKPRLLNISTVLHNWVGRWVKFERKATFIQPEQPHSIFEMVKELLKYPPNWGRANVITTVISQFIQLGRVLNFWRGQNYDHRRKIRKRLHYWLWVRRFLYCQTVKPVSWMSSLWQNWIAVGDANAMGVDSWWRETPRWAIPRYYKLTQTKVN